MPRGPEGEKRTACVIGAAASLPTATKRGPNKKRLPESQPAEISK
jgi:hypothetical protein